jgi:hypothetical protein
MGPETKNDCTGERKRHITVRSVALCFSHQHGTRFTVCPEVLNSKTTPKKDLTLKRKPLLLITKYNNLTFLEDVHHSFIRGTNDQWDLQNCKSWLPKFKAEISHQPKFVSNSDREPVFLELCVWICITVRVTGDSGKSLSQSPTDHHKSNMGLGQQYIRAMTGRDLQVICLSYGTTN